jgi:hypothetical protein
LKFQVIQELQKHDPSEQWQAIQIAIQPLVLPHDVARGFEQGAEGLGGGFFHLLILDGIVSGI